MSNVKVTSTHTTFYFKLAMRFVSLGMFMKLPCDFNFSYI